jgi:hypothetical protein
MIGFWDAVSMIKAADSSFSTAISRAVKLAEKWGGAEAEMHGYYLERVEWLLDDMESYLGAVRKHIAELRGNQTVRQRIALLRVTTGRTPEEAEQFRRKADELEQRLEEVG